MSDYQPMPCGRQLRDDQGRLFTCDGRIEVRIPVYFDVLTKKHEPHKLSLSGSGTHEDSVEIVANCTECGAAPARVMYPPIFRAVEALAQKPETYLRRPRIDVIVYVDSDGNPETEYFVNGQQINAPVTHDIHEHVIDPGRSGADHAWACSMYDSSINSSIPAAVRDKFTDALDISGHDCKAELCDSCENCRDEPCPLLATVNACRFDGCAEFPIEGESRDGYCGSHTDLRDAHDDGDHTTPNRNCPTCASS